jgi:hypothetical protein
MFCTLSSPVIQSLTFKQKYKNKLLQKHTKIQHRLKIKNEIALKKCNLMYNINTSNEECHVIWDEMKEISQEYLDNKEELILLEKYNFTSFIIYKVCKSFSNHNT